MRLLLDTHAFLWWVYEPRKLTAAAREAIGDDANQVLVSVVSAFEITTKFRLGKLDHAEIVARDVGAQLQEQGFAVLPVSLAHAERAGRLPGPQRDPFDRLLVAQALLDDLTFVSNEAVFDLYAVRRLW